MPIGSMRLRQDDQANNLGKEVEFRTDSVGSSWIWKKDLSGKKLSIRENISGRRRCGKSSLLRTRSAFFPSIRTGGFTSFVNTVRQSVRSPWKSQPVY